MRSKGPLSWVCLLGYVVQQPKGIHADRAMQERLLRTRGGHPKGGRISARCAVVSAVPRPAQPGLVGGLTLLMVHVTLPFASENEVVRLLDHLPELLLLLLSLEGGYLGWQPVRRTTARPKPTSQ